MKETIIDFHEIMKRKLYNGVESKYKTMIFGFASAKCKCTKPVEALFSSIVKCPIEFGKGLGVFYSHIDIAKAFLHEDRMHVAKKTLIGAGCSEEDIEKVLKQAGAKEKEINFILNKLLVV